MLNLTVTSDLNSLVGLLGVDQSVLLLKTGNDLDESSIASEIKRYAYPEHSNTYLIRNNTYQDFLESNFAVITNANEEYRESSSNTFECFQHFFFHIQERQGFTLLMLEEDVEA
jgi:CD109 antigen